MDINSLDLNHLGDKWLELKVQRMRNLLKIAEPNEALYREIMLSLGYPKNKVQFLELSLITPYKEIKSLYEREIIEKALLYRAGFSDSRDGLPANFDFSLRMDKSVWEFRGIRPLNYPNKRIKGISFLLSQSASLGLVNFFINKIQIISSKFTISESIDTKNINTKLAKNCVENIMDFQGIGIERKREMFFNIILPFCLAYLEELTYLEEKDSKVIEFLNFVFITHPPLSDNSITKKFKSLINKFRNDEPNISIRAYFGIHFFMKNFMKNYDNEGIIETM